jgi:hypothetical protein
VDSGFSDVISRSRCNILFRAMMKFISVILISLACFGFTAKLLDKFSETELVFKECSEADEKGEKEKKEKETKEHIVFTTETGFIVLPSTTIQGFDQTSFSEGFVSGPYNPPDLL